MSLLCNSDEAPYMSDYVHEQERYQKRIIAYLIPILDIVLVPC